MEKLMRQPRHVVMDEDPTRFKRYDTVAAEPGEGFAVLTANGYYELRRNKDTQTWDFEGVNDRGNKLEEGSVQFALARGAFLLHSVVPELGNGFYTTTDGMMTSRGRIEEIQELVPSNLETADA